MLDKARPYANPILQTIAKPFLRIHPNVITIIGFLGGIIFFCAMSRNHYWPAVAAFIIIFVDSLDGTIARMAGKETAFGAFFDSSLDRLTDCFAILAFATAGLVSWPLATSVAIASLMISYIRGKAEQVGNNQFKLAVGIVERPERLLTLFITTILVAANINIEYQGYNLYELIFITLLFLSTITIIQRFYAAWFKLR